ncbi:MAG: ABC transporter substrate-binding protein [Solirubrobacteraceae bacterium]
MRDETQRTVDAIRRRSSEVENHLIDEYRTGYIDRREFVRRGAVMGMSATALSLLASACGRGGSRDTAPVVGGKGLKSKVKPGGVVKAAINSPAGALDPVSVNNDGGLAVLGQTGEFLAWSDRDLKLQPRLAESWTPNRDGSVWTFKLRRGVTFHDGTPMIAQDVVETYDRLADPKNSSNALSTLAGILAKGGATAVDDGTVRFELEAPNGNFPYITSSDNYNAIILPRSYEGNWDKTFIGTGPWKLEKYTPDVGVSYVKNPDYWDKARQPNADRTELHFYTKEQASVLGLQGGEVDMVAAFSASGGKSLLNDPNVKVIELRSAAHRQVHMRTDKEPFRDKRVRQAMALLVNRAGIVDGLFEKKADIGNDHPFAPVYQSADDSLAQRKQDVARAKQLLANAGKPDGFSVELRTWDGLEIPDYAQLIQNDAKLAGIDIKLNITDSASYYGDAVFGNSPWLDSTMGITDYSQRGVPNVFLGAPLRSDGSWNAAHFKNPTYDKLVAEYTAALDLQTQRGIAKRIEELLIDETPVMFTYFYFFLTATTPRLANVEVTATSHVDLTRAGFTS